MSAAGGSRRRTIRALMAAYSGGLLSDDTFAARLDQALESPLVDPVRLIGDLNLRRKPRGRVLGLGATLARAVARFAAPSPSRRSVIVLGLDWSGGQSELLIGRHHACDVMLGDETVSRQHARLVFRDEKWILQDLHSTNGTAVNGTVVGRCELRPGDLLALGNEWMAID